MAKNETEHLQHMRQVKDAEIVFRNGKEEIRGTKKRRKYGDGRTATKTNTIKGQSFGMVIDKHC